MVSWPGGCIALRNDIIFFWCSICNSQSFSCWVLRCRRCSIGICVMAGYLVASIGGFLYMSFTFLTIASLALNLDSAIHFRWIAWFLSCHMASNSSTICLVSWWDQDWIPRCHLCFVWCYVAAHFLDKNPHMTFSHPNMSWYLVAVFTALTKVECCVATEYLCRQSTLRNEIMLYSSVSNASMLVLMRARSLRVWYTVFCRKLCAAWSPHCNMCR